MLDPDPLARLLAAPAVAALGFCPVVVAPSRGHAADAPVAVFVSLDRAADCRRVRREAGPALSAARLVAGTARGRRRSSPRTALTAAATSCCGSPPRPAGRDSSTCRLRTPVSAAGLSAREADVLVLLLHGLTTPAVAARLGVADSTARSHCRAVLRKLGAPDRRALRARLLAGPGAGPADGCRGPGPQVCRGRGASFAEESVVASRARGAHT